MSQARAEGDRFYLPRREREVFRRAEMDRRTAALEKSTEKLPEGDIKIAEQRMKRYLEENEDD